MAEITNYFDRNENEYTIYQSKMRGNINEIENRKMTGKKLVKTKVDSLTRSTKLTK